MRAFLPQQLLHCEAELLLVGSIATDFAWYLGDLSDRQHWDAAAAVSVVERAAPVIAEMRRAVDRVDGLVKAYEMVLEARGNGDEG